MAAVTSAAVSIPSFAGLKAAAAATTTPSRITTLKMSSSASASAPPPKFTVKASLKDIGAAVVATAASAILAANAMAIEVKLGGDDGALAFVPGSFSVAAGEKIVFKNNAGFPHNVIFDEDEVPSGVDAAAISMSEEDLLNAPGEEYSVTLTKPGTYTFYCSPHQGAGMSGKVTVN